MSVNLFFVLFLYLEIYSRSCCVHRRAMHIKASEEALSQSNYNGTWTDIGAVEGPASSEK